MLEGFLLLATAVDEELLTPELLVYILFMLQFSHFLILYFHYSRSFLQLKEISNVIKLKNNYLKIS